VEKLKPGRPGKMPALTPEQSERWLAARMASCGMTIQWKVARTVGLLAGEDQTRAREAAVTAFHEMIDQIWQLQDEVRAATGRQGRGV
jgi:hypothetical protein